VYPVDPRPALTLFLMANPQREIERRAKAIFERCAASNLAANVPDHAAEPGAQELELAPGALELVGMRVASHHHGGALCGHGGWRITIYLGMSQVLVDSGAYRHQTQPKS
jgi:hypothetical protein